MTSSAEQKITEKTKNHDFLRKSIDTCFNITKTVMELVNMSTENDLIEAIKDALKNDGTLGKFKAEMRTKIMDVLSGQVAAEKPQLSNEMLLLNELIREYLTWNGYKFTKSVFIEESGLNSQPLTRSQLLEDLGVCDTPESSKFSILYGVITGFKEDIKGAAGVDISKD